VPSAALAGLVDDVRVMTDEELRRIADRLVAVPGVAGVMLGGSRARGAEHPDSDVDLGLYYRRPLGVTELQTLAETLAEARSGVERPTVTETGGWGPWVDGGGWLSIGGIAVDWIYRDLDRVQESAALARDGRFSFHFQVGHPLGIPDFAYAGEVALGIVLADPGGELTELKDRLATYPPALTRAVVGRLEEAYFLLDGLEKSAKRADVVLVAGSLFRVIGLCAHAVHAKAGQWVISEKGLVEAAGRLPTAPPQFTVRAQTIMGGLGTDAAALGASLDAARALVDEIADA
jgi:predicted nucleotidyltransferase